MLVTESDDFSDARGYYYQYCYGWRSTEDTTSNWVPLKVADSIWWSAGWRLYPSSTSVPSVSSKPFDGD